MAFLRRCDRKPVLPLPEGALGFCIPCGIGDASWLYSKLKHLPALTGREVYLSMPDAEPRRGHQLLELLPCIHWAGYETCWRNEDVFQRALPGTATVEDLKVGEWHALEVNTWLEKGKSLAEWLPWLPTDYHYEIPISARDRKAGKKISKGLPGPVWSVYVSNRDKENYRGWALWSGAAWTALLAQLPGSFVFLGADYDRDKTEDVATALASMGRSVGICVGERLGVALTVLGNSDRFIAYPSGIGILANVLRVPGLMLLSDPLPGLETTFADPEDLRTGRYRAWVSPTPQEALAWLRGQ